MTYTGYEGEAEETFPPPSEVEWVIETVKVSGSPDKHKNQAVFVRIKAGKEVLGMIRLPNNDYLRHLRQKVQETHDGISAP